MPRTLKATVTAKPRAEAKPRVVAERKRTPVRRKVTAPVFDAAAHQAEIAHAAYMNWLARDADAGSPEDDWFRAEQSVRAKYSH